MRTRSILIGSSIITMVVMMLTLSGAPAAPLIIFNPSPSVPIGFYRRVAAPPRRGAFVTVRASAVAAGYAAQRRFNGPRNWFIKRVAATAGARVCAIGAGVDVGGVVLIRRSSDGAGRPLPWWRGCRRLGDDELFLAGDNADSFDSRYWGPVRVAQISGVWAPIGTHATSSKLRGRSFRAGS